MGGFVNQGWLIIGLMTIAAFAMGMTLLFTPRFYVVAMLFVIFDIEAIFIFPWAVIFDSLGWYGFASMMSFIGLLFLGYIYAWKKGALEWV